MTRRHPTARRGAAPLAGMLLVVALPACSSDGRELADPVFPPPVAETTTTVPTTVVLTVPTTLPADTTIVPTSDATDGGRVVFDRLYSPANATAEVVGTGAAVGDPVTVDGLPADVITFDVHTDGTFTVQVWIEDEGAHTVCVADTCGRVYTLAPDAETPEEVVVEIEQAIELAADVIPYQEWFPDWSIEIGGALSGTGGSTDVERRVVVVYRNRGRTVDDFVRTILHEFGHVADAVRLDDEERTAYLAAAGFEPGTAWRDPEAQQLDDWARQPAEDFAEVLVAAWTDGRWLPRTRTEPSDELLAAAVALVGLDDVG